MRPNFLTLLFVLVLAGCGGGGGDPGGADNNSGDTGPDPVPGIFVRADVGDDINGDGSVGNPFKTITVGLAAAAPGDIVRVGRGTYDAALGEVFPLEVPLGVTVQGTEDLTVFGGKKPLTFVEGGGLWSDDPEGRLHGTFVPGPGSTLIGLSMTNPEPFGPFDGPKPAPVILAQPQVTIESCVLHTSDKGIRMVEGAIDCEIRDCEFTGNLIGVFISGAGDGNLFERCKVLENGTGVMMFTVGADFGGGATGSEGRNAFADNDASDFVFFTGTTDTVFAMNCLWDVATPTVATGNPPSIIDADIWQATGFVETAGASKFQSGPVVGPVGPVLGP